MAKLSAEELAQAKAKVEELKATAIRVTDGSEMPETPRKPLSDEDLEKISGGSYTYVDNQLVWINDGYDGFNWDYYGSILGIYNPYYTYYTYGTIVYAELDQYGKLWYLIDDGCGGYWIEATKYNGTQGVVWY